MIRSIFTCFCVCFLAAQVVSQSFHPALQIGKKGRSYHAPITPVQLDYSTRWPIYFRRDTTMPWEPVGNNAYYLRPLFYNDPLLAEDFRKFQKTRRRPGICVAVASVSYVTFTISGLAAILSNLGEYPGGLSERKRTNPAALVAMGSCVASIGFGLTAVNLRKGARKQLVDLIHRYNDSSLSMAPVPPQKGWSLGVGFSGTGNSVGLGLHLRPN